MFMIQRTDEHILSFGGKVGCLLQGAAVGKEDSESMRGRHMKKTALALAVLCVSLFTLCSCGKIDENAGSAGQQMTSSTETAIAEAVDESEHAEYDYPAMVMIDNCLYYDSGEISTDSGCGNADGTIADSTEVLPTENDQSNFGAGYEYQLMENNTVGICIDNEWHIFVAYQEGVFDEVDKLLTQ